MYPLPEATEKFYKTINYFSQMEKEGESSRIYLYFYKIYKLILRVCK